jgi:hypothetical protein
MFQIKQGVTNKRVKHYKLLRCFIEIIKYNKGLLLFNLMTPFEEKSSGLFKVLSHVLPLVKLQKPPQ